MRDVSTVSGRKAFVVFLIIAIPACRRQESASERLRALAPRSGRPIEARLTGFDWQAMRLQRTTQAGLLDPARLELAGAASTVIQSLVNDPSARSRHESGAAYLLIERDRDAIDALESAVQQSPKEAGYWSDLAAARYTHAVREKRPHELPQALADADHALQLAPALPDALFNRALIIEALGITEAARRAWQCYVAVDPSTHWSTEAMSHLGGLHVATSRDDFERKLNLASRAKRRGDDAPLVALARNYPQQARTWSEGPLLASWADAVRAGKAKPAAETLSVARVFGSALAEINHDQSIHDAVAAIDRATADPERVRMLAEAHAAYRDARLLYRERHVAESERHFRTAAELFDRCGSPMALITNYYLTSCLNDSNRPAEARKVLDDLAAHFDHGRYPSLFAEIEWNHTLYRAATGDWDGAIRSATESRRIFASLGETENRGEMDLLLANDLSHISQHAAAWRARVAAFPVLSRAGSYDRIRNSLITAMNTENSRGEVDAARSLARVALDDLRKLKQPSAMSAAEGARGVILAKAGDAVGARAAVGRARRLASTIPDVELRKRASVSIDISEAIVERRVNPSHSLKLLDDAISFFTVEHRNEWLPQAYLERGRTHVVVNDRIAALADFEAGLRLIEEQRASLRDREQRGSFYDTEPELFSETITLLLHQGDEARAFEFSDSARARSLYEQLGAGTTADMVATADQLRALLPPRTALIEYAVLPDAIIIFYFSSSRSGVERVAAEPLALRSSVERFVDLLQHRGDVAAVNRASADLHHLLIAPVSAQLAGTDRLIIVPDRELHTIPWAALYDRSRRRYLVDDFAISVAPSGGSMLLRREARPLAPVLVVGDPHDEGAPSLPEAAREAAEIAAMYDSSTLLEGDRATRSGFLAAAQRSGMIHYAGHAVSDATDPFGALHLAADRLGGTGDLDKSDIAALHFTNAPLVILAACGTMRGESGHVEGMPSIARAFLAAGARSVVGTLWEVDDDAVAPLFHKMHVELHSGASSSSALRTAQIALAHDPDPRLRHPSSWAPVELLGYSSEQTTTAKKGANDVRH